MNLREVAVEFVQGELAPGGSELDGKELDRRAVQLPCMIGESIALKEAGNSGTLGGLLDLKMPGRQDYTTFGLTCFHVVNPSEKGLDPVFLNKVKKWREGGIRPEDSMRKRLLVEHPSPSAIKKKHPVNEFNLDGTVIKPTEAQKKQRKPPMGRRGANILKGFTEGAGSMRSAVESPHAEKHEFDFAWDLKRQLVQGIKATLKKLNHVSSYFPYAEAGVVEGSAN
ncbi:hypothetical protein N7445_008339 [Penicillium cf. griseofulvum]|nr:hypothetical protein N7445_008339 [Penicillium cf. griseofulvum]